MMDNRNAYIKGKVLEILNRIDSMEHKDVVFELRFILDSCDDFVECWNCKNLKPECRKKMRIGLAHICQDVDNLNKENYG